MTSPARTGPTSSWRSTAFIAGAAVLWGATLPVGRSALRSVDAPTLMVATRAVGSVTLVILVIAVRRMPTRAALRSLAPASLALGTTLFAGYWFQTEGLARTSATSAGFVLSLYVVLTPVVAWVTTRTRIRRRDAAVVAVAFDGLLLIATMRLGIPTFTAGTLLLVASATTWAGHIVLLAHLAARHEPVAVALGQLVVATVLHVLAAIPSGVHPEAAGHVLPQVLALGALGSGVAYAVQALGQRGLPPQRAAVVISLEAVVSAVVGVLWLGESMRPHQWLGASLILGAIVAGGSRADRPDDGSRVAEHTRPDVVPA